MKKLMIAIVILLSGIIAIPTSAHSGRTDSKGGHWDRSSGEYHFHHGYGPHDHYDMDGDGDDDCPYEFDSRVIGITSTSQAYDKGYAAGEKSGYDEGYEYGRERGYKDGKKDAEDAAKIEIKKAADDASLEAYFASALLGIPAVVFLTHHRFEAQRMREEKTYQAEIQRLKQELNLEKNKNVLQQTAPGFSVPSDLPHDVVLNLSCTPIKGRSSKDRPFGEYTVYTTANGKKYHYKYKCCNATNPVHLFKIPYGLTACSNCVPQHIRNNRSPSWYLAITSGKVFEKSEPEQIPPHQPTLQTIAPIKTDDSTAFSFIDYQNTVLILVFRSGGEYHYYDVPKNIYEGLLSAPSKGRYYHEHIKDKYPYY